KFFIEKSFGCLCKFELARLKDMIYLQEDVIFFRDNVMTMKYDLIINDKDTTRSAGKKFPIGEDVIFLYKDVTSRLEDLFSNSKDLIQYHRERSSTCEDLIPL